jgi:hypothetical protein
VEYFLRHKEVKRLLAMVDEDDMRDNSVIKKAGFGWLSRVPTVYKMDNLYVYPQEG